jgi:hypothetical protein
MGLTLLAYAGVCAYLWWQQRALIFPPEAEVRHAPSDLGMPFRDVSIPVAAGETLHGWWLPIRAWPRTRSPFRLRLAT